MGDPAEAELAVALGEALVAAGAPGPVTIGDLRRLSGGASRETWSFAAVTGVDRLQLILQRVRGGLTMGGPSLAAEDALLTAAEHAGVPVPPVVVDAAGCAETLGAARITAHVDGEALGPRIVRRDEFAAARAVLPAQCGRALAAIHSIDPAAVPGLEPVDTSGRLRDGLDLLGEHRPAFELALRWLDEHRPPARPPSVVHGDFRVGNLLVDPDHGLSAVLDWELAHLGDPIEDLGWLCVRSWRFGGADEVGGVGPLDDLLDAYNAASGDRPATADEVRWWIVAGTLTWGLICAVQARRHLDGHVRSVELATIGRRVCETEYDLLDLLGITAITADPDAAAGPEVEAPPIDLHGRPTAPELQDAIDAHLAEHAGEDGSAAAFQARVAANAQAIVDREHELGPAMAASASARLTTLGHADEPALAAAIRNGEITVDPGSPAATTIRALVVDRVRVANPKWLLPPDVA